MSTQSRCAFDRNQQLGPPVQSSESPFGGLYKDCFGGTARPFVYPELNFTPLIYPWQQADFRPLHFQYETRESAKGSCKYGKGLGSSWCPGTHRHDQRNIIMPFRVAHARTDFGRIVKTLYEEESEHASGHIDGVYVVFEGDQGKRAFMNQVFTSPDRVRNKLGRIRTVYLNRTLTYETLCEFARVRLTGSEHVILF